MTELQITYGLLAALAIALLHACYTDIKRREIEDWLNAGIALSAPLFWWASGYDFWPDLGWQIAVAAGVFMLFTAMFAIGAMGGGDVKLLTALALWFPFPEMLKLIVVMSLAGGAITIILAAIHKIRRSPEKLEIPYGLAIGFAGFWIVGERYLNQFT